MKSLQKLAKKVIKQNILYIMPEYDSIKRTQQQNVTNLIVNIKSKNDNSLDSTIEFMNISYTDFYGMAYLTENHKPNKHTINAIMIQIALMCCEKHKLSNIPKSYVSPTEEHKNAQFRKITWIKKWEKICPTLKNEKQQKFILNNQEVI